MLQHLLSASQLTPPVINDLFNTTKELEDRWQAWQKAGKRGAREIFSPFWLPEVGIFSLFYEASTRTRMSFESGVKLIGGNVLSETEAGKMFSSAAKGESLEHTIEVLRRYGPHAIVLRHSKNGAAETAAKITGDSVSIINAGDGNNEHPSQALLDLYTIYRLFGRISGLSVLFMGDIAHSRVIRSDALLLAQYGATMYFASPGMTRMDDFLRHSLRAKGAKFYEVGEEWPDLIWGKKVDLVVQTRLQLERMGRLFGFFARRMQRKFTITLPIGQVMNRNDIYLMHPMPIVNEIETACDHLSIAKYFDQAGYGILTRMATYCYIFQEHLATGSIPQRDLELSKAA